MMVEKIAMQAANSQLTISDLNRSQQSILEKPGKIHGTGRSRTKLFGVPRQKIPEELTMTFHMAIPIGFLVLKNLC